jgi:hypothetical protein
MYTLISYPAGIIFEAVVLDVKENRMRVAASGIDDTLELKRIGAQWYAEGGKFVEFEFLACGAPQKQTRRKTLSVKTMTAS